MSGGQGRWNREGRSIVRAKTSIHAAREEHRVGQSGTNADGEQMRRYEHRPEERSHPGYAIGTTASSPMRFITIVDVRRWTPGNAPSSLSYSSW